MESTYLPIRYKAALGQPLGTDMHSYRIDEWYGIKLLRSFTIEVSRAPSTKSKASERAIERWCGLKPDQLPKNGGTISVDLKEVQIL
jgi:hypothetical protein